MTLGEQGGVQGAGGATGRIVYTIAVLMLVTLSSQLDRNLTALLIEPIKRDLGVSDVEMGLVHGAGFAVFYAIFGLPFGWLVDRTNRRNLVIVGIVIWSSMTITCGLANGFWPLMLARAGVGIGEACLMPAAYSLIADLVEPHQRGRAIAIYFSSASLGQGLSLILGGAVLALFSTGAALAIAPLADWRMVFLAAGLPGYLLAALLLTVREPARRGTAQPGAPDEPVQSWRYLFAYLARHINVFAPIFICFTLLSFAVMGAAAWAPTFYVRAFGADLRAIGFTLGLASLVGGFTGSLLGGVISDWLASRHRFGSRLGIAVLCWGITMPLLVVWPRVGSMNLSLAVFAIGMAGAGTGAATVGAILQDLAPNRLRGRIVAFFSLLAGIFGFGLGPPVVALLTDHVFGDPRALSQALSLVALTAGSVGLVMALSALRPYAALRAVVADGGSLR